MSHHVWPVPPDNGSKYHNNQHYPLICYDSVQKASQIGWFTEKEAKEQSNKQPVKHGES